MDERHDQNNIDRIITLMLHYNGCLDLCQYFALYHIWELFMINVVINIG